MPKGGEWPKIVSTRARSSVGERFLDAEEVVGSIPSAPTRIKSPETERDFWTGTEGAVARDIACRANFWGARMAVRGAFPDLAVGEGSRSRSRIKAGRTVGNGGEI